MGNGEGCSRFRARLKALRSTLLLDGLPAGFYQDCWRAKSGLLRNVEVTNAFMIVAVNPVLMIGHGTRDLLLKMYSPQRLLLVIALGAVQMYLMLWRSRWWDEHRHRLMVPLYLVRCVTYGDAWAAFARYRTIELGAGDPARQFSYAVVSATSFPLQLGNTCHAVSHFKGHLVVHSLITAAFLVYHQPVFVGLFRWAPCFDQALQLQQQLQGSFAAIASALLGAPTAVAPVQQHQHQPLGCPLLQLSLWIHLASAWLLPTYILYIYFSSTQRSFMRDQAVAVLGHGASLAAFEQQAEAMSNATLAGSSDASCSRGARQASDRSPTHQQAASNTAGTAETAAAPPATQRGALRHVSGTAQAAAVHGQTAAPEAAAAGDRWPNDETVERQQLLLEHAASSRYPAASQQQIRHLSQAMLASLHPPFARASLGPRIAAAAAWHLCVFGLLLMLLWMACTVVALAVQRLATGAHYEWTSMLCDAYPTATPLYADGFA